MPSEKQPVWGADGHARPQGRWLVPLSLVAFGAGALAPTLAGFDLSPPPPQSTRQQPTLAPRPKRAQPAEAALRLRNVVVTSCADTLGRRQPSCDLPELGHLVEPVLAQLAQCGEALPLPLGRFSLGLDLDFTNEQVRALRAGASTQLPPRAREGLMGCAEADLLGVSLRGLDHEHEQYWVYFVADIELSEAPADSAAVGAEPPPKGQEADAESWPLFSGVVRTMRPIRVLSAPAEEGPLATVLPAGVLLRVTGRRAGFCRVTYSDGTKQGWAAAADLGL